MQDQRFWRAEQSRRIFFHRSGVALAGGSAVFLAACGDDNKDGASTVSTPTGGNAAQGDIEVLNSALDLENMAVAAYTAGAALLKGKVLAAGKLFAEQEQEHADGLTQAIKDLGGTPNKAKKVDEYGFPSLGSQEDVLNFALDIENTAVAAYIDALPKLSSPELRGTAAAIVTNEAEHISVLLGALGKPQAPDAFVVGRKA